MSKNMEIRIESVANGFVITCHDYGLPEEVFVPTRTTQVSVADSPMTPYGRYNSRYVASDYKAAVRLVDWLLSGEEGELK